MITAIIAFCVFALMAFRVWIEWPATSGDFSLVKLHRSYLWDPRSTWGMLVSALVACFIGLKARLRFVDNDPTDPRFPK